MKKMLYLKHALYSRWLKSVFLAWGITAFKDYYNYFMCKHKKSGKKPQTTQILNPPFSSFNGLCVNAKQKEVTERKAYKMDALPAAENHSLAVVHGAIPWAARGLSQLRIEVIFRTL